MQTARYEIDTLNTLIDDLQKNHSDEARVQLIKEAAVDLEQLAGYHYFGDNSYGRNLIFSNDDFEIILMCWRSGQQSVAHEHSNSLCVMKCLGGSLQEQRYKKLTDSAGSLQGGMDQKAERIIPTVLTELQLNDATSIKDSEGLHSLKNDSLDNACTLHFYFPPIHQSKIYDLDNGSQRTVSSKFTSEYGVKL